MSNVAVVLESSSSTVLQRSERAFSTTLSEQVLPRAKPSPFPSLAEIPVEHRFRKLDQSSYLVNGEMRRWEGKMAEVHSPLLIRDFNGEAKGPLLGSYPWMDAKAALETLDAAKKAYNRGLGTWPLMSVEERIACVEKFLGGMVAVRDQVVNLLMWEIGKTLPDAQKEFDRTVEYVRDTIKDLRATTTEGLETSTTGGIASRVEKGPRGVVLCMGPFNYPLNETLTTLMPALLMGNTIVVKPPKIGVLLYQPLLKAFQESFPPGVVNTVYGDGAEVITPIMKDGGVSSLSFIGSDKVADIIVKSHKGPSPLHTVLGLGAKNPGVILPDADIARAVEESVIGSLSYNGQRCTALKMIFVHRSVAEEFVEKFSAKVAQLKQGMPWIKGAQITPLAEPNKVNYMREYIDDAVVHGARVINAGGGEAEGTLFTPAVLYPVARESKIYHQEQFGPVVPIVPFDDVSEVAKWLQESPYGQQLSVFTSNPRELKSFAWLTRNLVTRINVNTQCQRGPDNLPFAGRKNSAMGTLSIRDALNEFSISTVLAGKDESTTHQFLKGAL